MNSKPCRLVPFAMGVAAFVAAMSLTPGQAYGEREKHWRIPVVMEKATVRGKVVILETRREDRKTIADLRVEVWTTQKDEPQKKGSLLHETKTDEGGLFTLPLIEEGQYILVVGSLRLNLTVTPQADVRKGQSEPKVLLILLPKDVV